MNAEAILRLIGELVALNYQLRLRVEELEAKVKVDP